MAARDHVPHTTETVAQVYELERSVLHPLPLQRFEACRIQPGKVSKISTVRFDANQYSMPIRYAGQAVWVKVFIDQVILVAQNEVIAKHERCRAHYLKQLRLPTIAKQYASLAREAVEHGLSYEAYLLALVEQETATREENHHHLRLRHATFPIQKTLDTFEFHHIPSLNKHKVLSLAQGEFVTASALVEELLLAKEEHRLLSMEKQWLKYAVVICDELGYVLFSKTGGELLFQFFSARHERCSTMITSNLDFGEWVNVFGDEKMTAALLDRMTHRAHILLMNGDSYRFRQSLHRLHEDQE